MKTISAFPGVRPSLLLAGACLLLSACTMFWPEIQELPKEAKYERESDAYDDSKMGKYVPKKEYGLPPAKSLPQALDRLQRYADAYIGISNSLKRNDLATADVIAASVFLGAISLIVRSDHGLNAAALTGATSTTIANRYRLQEQWKAYKAASDAMVCMRDAVVMIDDTKFSRIRLKGIYALTQSEVIGLINEKIRDTNRKLHQTMVDLRPVMPDRQGIIDAARQFGDRKRPGNETKVDQVGGQQVTATNKMRLLQRESISEAEADMLAEVVSTLKPKLESCISENM